MWVTRIQTSLSPTQIGWGLSSWQTKNDLTRYKFCAREKFVRWDPCDLSRAEIGGVSEIGGRGVCTRVMCLAP